MKFGSILISLGLVAAVSAPALAHHSFAMFAVDKTVTLNGTVKEFEWVNPHSWLHVSIVTEAGMPEEWAFEMGSPGQLASRGWAKDSVKVGDKITITAHPMKDGSHGGSEMSVKTASGKVYGGVMPPPAQP